MGLGEGAVGGRLPGLSGEGDGQTPNQVIVSPGAGLIFSICPPTVSQCSGLGRFPFLPFLTVMKAVVINVLVPAAPGSHTKIPGQSLTLWPLKKIKSRQRGWEDLPHRVSSHQWPLQCPLSQLVISAAKVTVF